jgi:protocatechuate 3,4-dioxygenase alpha subunit
MSKVTPSQTVGPFFHYALPFSGGETIVDPSARDAIRIEGQVLDGEGTPVVDAMIEAWQADPDGIYNHPEDPRQAHVADGFHGFGRTHTDEDGRFHFLTVKPGKVPGPGNSLQAPHISVSVFARGLLDRVATRIYFADEEASNTVDPVLSSLPDATTLVATAVEGGSLPTYRFDIRLQGENETVFFDV